MSNHFERMMDNIRKNMLFVLKRGNIEQIDIDISAKFDNSDIIKSEAVLDSKKEIRWKAYELIE
jgi:hypothetical protein